MHSSTWGRNYIETIETKYLTAKELKNPPHVQFVSGLALFRPYSDEWEAQLHLCERWEEKRPFLHFPSLSPSISFSFGFFVFGAFFVENTEGAETFALDAGWRLIKDVT